MHFPQKAGERVYFSSFQLRFNNPTLIIWGWLMLHRTTLQPYFIPLEPWEEASQCWRDHKNEQHLASDTTWRLLWMELETSYTRGPDRLSRLVRTALLPPPLMPAPLRGFFLHHHYLHPPLGLPFYFSLTHSSALSSDPLEPSSINKLPSRQGKTFYWALFSSCL